MRGILLFFTFALCGALWAVHLLMDVGPFGTYRGSFLLGVLGRAAAITYAFACLDGYLLATGQGTPRRRTTVLLNLLIPGSGYLLVGRWTSGLIGLSAGALCAHLARNPSNVVDAIFVGVQVISAVGLYSRQLNAEAAAENQPQPAPPTHTSQGAQLVLLGVLTTTAIFCGWLVFARTMDYQPLSLSRDSVRVRRRDGAVHVRVPSHGAELTAYGQGWIVDSTFGRALFTARHRLGATLLFGVEPLIPFLGVERYLHRVQMRVESSGYKLVTRTELSLHGKPATQFRFSKRLGDHTTTDRWAIVLPRGDYGYLLMFGCRRQACEALHSALEKTRDSLRVK